MTPLSLPRRSENGWTLVQPSASQDSGPSTRNCRRLAAQWAVPCTQPLSNQPLRRTGSWTKDRPGQIDNSLLLQALSLQLFLAVPKRIKAARHGFQTCSVPTGPQHSTTLYRFVKVRFAIHTVIPMLLLNQQIGCRMDPLMPSRKPWMSSTTTGLFLRTVSFCSSCVGQRLQQSHARSSMIFHGCADRRATVATKTPLPLLMHRE